MARRGELLEHHTLVVRDGRILEVLPDAAARERYAPRMVLERPEHLLMPGLINARTRIAPGGRADAAAPFPADAALLSIANMLCGGTTCFGEIGYFPQAAAQTAVAQGMRAMIGLPVAEHPSPWAREPGEYLTRALGLRDEYKGHPTISTGFAPLGAATLSDATFARIGTLADELDAGVLLCMHRSQREIDASIREHGRSPMARLQGLGLLTPALTAAHLVRLDGPDIELAQRGGIGVTLCPASDLRQGNGVAPIAALTAAGLRMSLGSDGAVCGPAQDLWSEIRLIALHAQPPIEPWDVLAAATRTAAAVMGLDAEIGTLEAGKWADLCCLDLRAPPVQPLDDPLRQLVFSGGRDMVSDVWVAGRQLLSKRQFTRLDWQSLAARLSAAPRA